MRNYRGGPWRAELPFFASGYAVVDLVIESPAESTTWVLQPLTLDGERVGEAQPLECKSSRLTKRVLRIPSAARRLELRQLETKVAWIGELKLKPLPERTALRMIERRLARPESGAPHLIRSQAAGTPHPDSSWRAYQNTFPLLEPPGYDWWVQRLEGPRMRAIDDALEERLALLPDRELFSVLVPVFDPDIELLRACLDSIIAQSYPDWEACLVDDASTNPAVRDLLREYADRDPRFRIHFRRKNGHISRTSQDALEMARGEFVGLLDHDDELARHALLLMAEALRDHPQAVVVYSDEDKLDASGMRCDPHFKPDFDLDRLLGHNYIAHLLVARRSEVLSRGGFRAGMEGSQDHDLVLRLVANQPSTAIIHLPEILYHWRKHARSTAQQLDSKPYALEAGRRAVLSYLVSERQDARVDLDLLGQCLRVRWAIPPNAPRVSIIVSARDGFALLSRCTRTLLDDTDYPNFELVVIDDGSRDPATLRYLDKVREDERVVVVRCPDAPNALALNNLAALKSTGLVLAFVSEAIQPVDAGWLREMVSHAIRPGVGAVGAKLLYPDGRIRHGGVVLDASGIAGPAFESRPGTDYGYFSKLRIAHTVSAVTAACLVVERRKFESVGRFDAEGLIAFGDVDLCLRLRAAGLRNVLTPHAVLTYRDSASNGTSTDEQEHLARERQIMRERWEPQLRSDPYYNPHLTSERADYGLRAG